MVREKVVHFLRKHKRLDYLQRCVRQINDDAFMQQVLDIDRDPMTLKFWHLGELNPDDNIYLIQVNSSLSGFCAYFRWTLDLLYFSDKFKLVPVVCYGDKFLHNENEPVNGTSNGFEYYFKPVNHITVEEAKHSRYVTFSSHAQTHALWDSKYSGYSPSDDYMASHGAICKKYIQINDAVKSQFDSEIPRLLGGKRTIGVQVRGTDFKLNFNGHPTAVTTEEYLPLVHNAMETGGFEQIFLATDEVDTIDVFKKEFGEAVVYYQDTMRSENSTNVTMISAQRASHKYLLGLEVLRDVWTLASCHGLIAGQSNVSICARIVNVSFGQPYEHLYIIDKGTNCNNNDCYKYYRGKL